MKDQFKALSLCLMLASPMTMGLPALAQLEQEGEPPVQRFEVNYQPPTPPYELLAEESSRSEQIRAFGFSKYSYWDARVLAKFWNTDVLEAKATMGYKILEGPLTKAMLDQHLVDARIKALANVEQLSLYSESDYGYEDAAALAKFWYDQSPYESKLRIERNLIMGNEEVVRAALGLALQKDRP